MIFKYLEIYIYIYIWLVERSLYRFVSSERSNSSPDSFVTRFPITWSLINGLTFDRRNGTFRLCLEIDAIIDILIDTVSFLSKIKNNRERNCMLFIIILRNRGDLL